MSHRVELLRQQPYLTPTPSSRSQTSSGQGIISRLFQYALIPLLAPWISPDAHPPSDVRSVVASAHQTYHDNIIAVLESKQANDTCTIENVSIRRAWDDLSPDDRLEFVNAVKCTTTIATRMNPLRAPGTRTLYDDFVCQHINQTEFTHESGLLLPWHRQFIWAFEQTLRNECGYTGNLPYWPWERHSSNQSLSPVFQKSPSSFGGNGARDGSLCIEGGAFASHVANIGPLASSVYNPHCITRNFSNFLSIQRLNNDSLADLYQTENIAQFKPMLDEGIHFFSHYFIGGEMFDLHSSPNDPVFWLLHAQIDRIWTTWQNQDWETRKDALYGTLTMRNDPPSEWATVDSPMTLGMAGGNMKIGQVMDSIGGQFCYMYV